MHKPFWDRFLDFYLGINRICTEVHALYFIFILGTGSLIFIVVLTLSALGFWNNSAQTILYLKFLVAFIVLRVRLLTELPVLGNNLGLSCANLRYQHSGVGIVQTQLIYMEIGNSVTIFSIPPPLICWEISKQIVGEDNVPLKMTYPMPQRNKPQTRLCPGSSCFPQPNAPPPPIKGPQISIIMGHIFLMRQVYKFSGQLQSATTFL